MERRATWVRVCHSWEEEAAADREYWARYSGDEKVAMISGMVAEWENRHMAVVPAPVLSEHGEFLTELNRAAVRFLIVGAYAVAFHAKPRYTKNLDVLVETTTDVAAPPASVHVLTSIDGVTFPDAWPHREPGTLAGQPVHYLSKADLIRSKEAVGRPMDRFDLDLLR